MITLAKRFCDLIPTIVADANIESAVTIVFRQPLSPAQTLLHICRQQTQITQNPYLDLLGLEDASIARHLRELVLAKVHQCFDFNWCTLQVLLAQSEHCQLLYAQRLAPDERLFKLLKAFQVSLVLLLLLGDGVATIAVHYNRD